MKISKMQAILPAGLAALVGLVAGCGNRSPMTGRWEHRTNGQVDSYYQFDADEDVVRLDRTRDLFTSHFTCVDQGIWKLDGERVLVARPGFSPKEPLFKRLDRSQFQWEPLAELKERDGRRVLEFSPGDNGTPYFFTRR